MPAERGTQVLIERDKELGVLDAAIEASVEGRGSVVLVHGPAGIGKSELLAVTASRARDAGFDVLTARGGENERSFGFGGWLPEGWATARSRRSSSSA